MNNQNPIMPNLMFSLKTLSLINLLKPCDKNYLWSRVAENVYGVEEIRARVGRFDTPWDNPSYFPVPDLDQSLNKSFSDIMDSRALDILACAKSVGKNIVILWSGGIDSTCILSAFIKNLSYDDLKRITVCTSLAGIAENPYFYQHHIRNKFKMLHWRDLDVTNDFFANNILLHGDPGDCIFGPSVVKYHSLLAGQQHLLPWKSNRALLNYLYHDPVAPTFAGWWVNKVSDNLAELQSQGKYNNVKSISDWHWWNYFNLKWHGSMTRALVNNKKNKKEKISSHHIQEFFDLTFFTNEDFQIWSYQNLDILMSHGINGHKRHAKEYIYELDSNEEYKSNKKKEASVVPIFHNPLILDQNAVHYYHNDTEIKDFIDSLIRQ